MKMKDLFNNLTVVNSVKPAVYIATVTGAAVDLQGYEGALIAIAAGVRTDGTHTPSLEHSDLSGSEYAAVPTSDMQGSFAAIATDVNQKVGYLGIKRYVRVIVTVSGATSGAAYSAVVVRGKPRRSPV